MHTHLCLVSAQPLPNVVPLLDPAMGVQRAVLTVTPDMAERADWLEAVLRPRGIRVERLELGDAWDYEQTQTRILEWLEREGEGGVVLNATGGTKLMSMAAYEAFRAYELPIFYVHPRDDRVIWLQPEELGGQELADRLRLEAFLQVHGAAVEGKPRRSVPEYADLDLAGTLVERLEDFAAPLGTLNWLAGQAGSAGECPRLEKEYPRLLDLLDLFEARGKLRYRDGHIGFPDEDARFFVNGGWIEAWVFDQVRQLRKNDPAIQDIAYAVNVQRTRRGRQVPNELDVVILRNNRLHIIECKTRRFRDEGEDSPGAEALYKLDILRDLMGGLQARAMLVSYRDLPDHDRTRAADLGIHVCAGSQLRRLAEKLREFLTD